MKPRRVAAFAADMTESTVVGGAVKPLPKPPPPAPHPAVSPAPYP